MVLRAKSTPKRASMRSLRYSGRWSQNLLTIRWASRPGPARPRGIGDSGRGAVRKVEVVGFSGIRLIVAGSFHSAAENDLAAVFAVAAAGAAAGMPAWRCFSQAGQAYVRRTCSITIRDAGS